MMLPILEKYFLDHGQLVLSGIGQLNLSQTDSIQSNGAFQPPVHQIIFDAMIEPTTKPSKLFYIYLSDHLDCTIEQAIIDYTAFFTNVSFNSALAMQEYRVNYYEDLHHSVLSQTDKREIVTYPKLWS